MPTITKERISEIQLPSDFKLSDVELPKVDLSKVELPRLDLSKVELPKADDVNKALVGAAAAVGLVKSRPRRWPYLVGGAIALAAVGWVAMNWSKVRGWVDSVTARVNQRMEAVQGEDEWDETVAFTAAETKPIESSIDAVGPMGSTLDEYPNGLGVQSETVGSTRA
jgi:hypothetical protein